MNSSMTLSLLRMSFRNNSISSVLRCFSVTSRFVNSLFKNGNCNPTQIEEVICQILPTLHLSDTIAMLYVGSKSTYVFSNKDVKSIVKILSESNDNLTSTQLANGFHAMRKIRLENKRIGLDLLSALSRKLKAISDLEGVVVSSAIYGSQHWPDALHSILHMLIPKLRETKPPLNSQQISFILHGLHRCDIQDPFYFDLMHYLANQINHLYTKHQFMKSYEICNCFYGFQSIRNSNSLVIRDLLRSLILHMKSKNSSQATYKSSDVSVALYGIQSLSPTNDEVFQILEEFSGILKNCSGKMVIDDVSNIMFGIKNYFKYTKTTMQHSKSAQKLDQVLNTILENLSRRLQYAVAVLEVESKTVVSARDRGVSSSFSTSLSPTSSVELKRLCMLQYGMKSVTVTPANQIVIASLLRSVSKCLSMSGKQPITALELSNLLLGLESISLTTFRTSLPAVLKSITNKLQLGQYDFRDLLPRNVSMMFVGLQGIHLPHVTTQDIFANNLHAAHNDNNTNASNIKHDPVSQQIVIEFLSTFGHFIHRQYVDYSITLSLYHIATLLNGISNISSDYLNDSEIFEMVIHSLESYYSQLKCTDMKITSNDIDLLLNILESLHLKKSNHVQILEIITQLNRIITSNKNDILQLNIFSPNGIAYIHKIITFLSSMSIHHKPVQELLVTLLSLYNKPPSTMVNMRYQNGVDIKHPLMPLCTMVERLAHMDTSYICVQMLLKHITPFMNVRFINEFDGRENVYLAFRSLSHFSNDVEEVQTLLKALLSKLLLDSTTVFDFHILSDSFSGLRRMSFTNINTNDREDSTLADILDLFRVQFESVVKVVKVVKLVDVPASDSGVEEKAHDVSDSSNTLSGSNKNKVTGRDIVNIMVGMSSMDVNSNPHCEQLVLYVSQLLLHIPEDSFSTEDLKDLNEVFCKRIDTENLDILDGKFYVEDMYCRRIKKEEERVM